MFYNSSGNPKVAITSNNSIYKLTNSTAKKRLEKHVTSLNLCIRKYIGENKKRMSIFLAQVLLETAQWRDLGGSRKLMHEWGFGAYNTANPATKYYTIFYGRGIMQLTWAGNYDLYGKYKCIAEHVGSYVDRLTPSTPRITQHSLHYDWNPNDEGHKIKWAPRYDPDCIAESIYLSCDSGGFYWVSKSFSEGMSINRVCDRIYSADNIGFINRLVNGGGNGYYERQAYIAYILKIFEDSTESAETVIISPTGKSTVQVNLSSAR
jgi:hydroxyethylthiazole kinase